MEEEMGPIKNVRTLATFLCGVVSLFILMQLGSWLGEPSAIAVLLIESGAFLLACVVGFVLTPRRPFRAALTVVFGVFVGIIIHIIVYPTINGFERNLFPLEIALHTLMAAIVCFLCAALWKVGSHFFASGRSSA
jgi:hypothetical protein